ncbi:1-phosphofructokinase family hexose kinase (plasmid) [Deinococcus psychrotolerans]|uniref:1-phosphofructokinase family hexose kinase n=1 Tax=Deinococcus psychrotolerans TaxID=2489213 RepID=A0A3G8YIQ8_9DEIO|nr:1-phosphofructokinase family hexose kinase [Deinococcus psychrotolerans]AZI44815.1 1-phosphofructokinase family hexose kinase [Deinococcus psychrotolerans]
MIVALTPNLSLDRTMTLNRPLVPGQLHRVTGLTVAAGGKGVNLARAVRAFGGQSCVAGVIGGFNGQYFRALLNAEGLMGVLEDGEGETRECQALLSGDSHPTEINEAGPPYQPEAVVHLLKRLPEGQVVVCGSLAPGTPRAGFLDMLLGLDRPVVDGSGVGLEAAVEAGASLIKPNEHELEGLTGSGTLDSARELYRRSGVQVLLTRGERGAAFVGEEVWEVEAPHIDAKNPVGSGDTLLGTFLWARQAGESVPDALRLAVAAGSANAMLGGPLKFRMRAARELVAQTRLLIPA